MEINSVDSGSLVKPKHYCFWQTLYSVDRAEQHSMVQ